MQIYPTILLILSLNLGVPLQNCPSVSADRVESQPISALVMMASPVCARSSDPRYHVEILSDHNSDCELCTL